VERLVPAGHNDWLRHFYPGAAQIRDRPVHVCDSQGQVLAQIGGSGGLDQVYLLTARVQPRSSEPEVRSIRSLHQTENLCIELDPLGDVLDVYRHVVETSCFHGTILTRFVAWIHKPTVARFGLPT
jgi:hypothetical protein